MGPKQMSALSYNRTLGKNCGERQGCKCAIPATCLLTLLNIQHPARHYLADRWLQVIKPGSARAAHLMGAVAVASPQLYPYLSHKFLHNSRTYRDQSC